MGGDTLLVAPGRWYAGKSYLNLYENCLSTAKEIAEVAERYDLTVGLENVENKFLLSPREWYQFIEEIGNSHLRIYFDVGNVLREGIGEPADWIMDLKKRICRVHLKDYLIQERKIVPLSKGDVNWPSVVQALKKISYDNWLSAELPFPENSQQEFFYETCRAIKKIWFGNEN